jgi:hypothetical protein
LGYSEALGDVTSDPEPEGRTKHEMDRGGPRRHDRNTDVDRYLDVIEVDELQNLLLSSRIREDVLNALLPIGPEVEAQTTHRYDQIESEDHSGLVCGTLEVGAVQGTAQLGEVHPAGELQLRLNWECCEGHDHGHKTKSFHCFFPGKVVSKWAGDRA